ncbi:hypothetical protein ACET9U_16920, partial [Aeromonas veronii]
EPAGMTTIGLSYSLVKISTKCAPALIGAMFQFQGGISDADKEKIAIVLQKKKIITITETGKVLYPE